MEKLSRLFYRVPPPVRKEFTIVSHNVFWFQGSSFPTDQPLAPRPEIMKRLCGMYRIMQPDVLCLQEIQDETVARTVAEALGMAYVYHRGGNYPQYGGAIFSRRPMEEIAPAQDVSVDRISISVTVRFPDFPRLRLAHIHLPSGRQRGAEEGQKQRLLELSAIAGRVDLLLGDFNETPNGRSAAFLKERGYVDAAEACDAGEEPSNVIAAGYRGDMIWIAESMASHLQGYFVVPKEKLVLHEHEKIFLSDHMPVGCFVGSVIN